MVTRTCRVYALGHHSPDHLGEACATTCRDSGHQNFGWKIETRLQWQCPMFRFRYQNNFQRDQLNDGNFMLNGGVARDLWAGSLLLIP